MDEQLTQQNEPTVIDAGQKSVQTDRYDFGEAQRLSGGQLQQLQQVHERFARELATSLAALTRRTLKAGPVSCRQWEADRTRPPAASSGLWIVLDVDPLETQAALAMDSRLVFALLEALLGGRVAGSGDVNRELTEIELSVLQDLHAVVVRELERAWRPAARFTFQVLRQQTGPQPAQRGPAAGGSVVTAFELEVESSTGQITLLYPLRIGRELQGASAEGPATDAARRPEMLQQALLDRLKSAMLAVEARLHGATLRLRDLADLRAGDLLCLDVPLDKPIEITVNGLSRFEGRLTESGRRKAIRIHEAFPSKAVEQRPR
jgi:flagellar motor switch protein FliM